MIKAIIWDFGGVLVRTQTWKLRHQWEERLGIPHNELSRLVFDSPIAQEAMHGRASSAEVWSWVCKHLKVGDESKNQLIHDFWSGDQLDRDLIEFIRQLKPRWKVGLITNAFPEIRVELEDRWQLTDVFDSIVVSAEEGITKPQPEIYQISLSQLKVSPSEAIFVDDFRENIAAATQLGMRAIHFVDPDRVKAAIEQLLNL